MPAHAKLDRFKNTIRFRLFLKSNFEGAFLDTSESFLFERELYFVSSLWVGGKSQPSKAVPVLESIRRDLAPIFPRYLKHESTGRIFTTDAMQRQDSLQVGCPVGRKMFRESNCKFNGLCQIRIMSREVV